MDIVSFDKDISVVCVKASRFPEGVLEAFAKLKALIPKMAERKLFGLSRPEHGTIEYKAATEEDYPEEAEALHAESLCIKKGNYISVTIMNYMKQMESVGKTFKDMLEYPGLDPNGYCVEWYISETEMKCMVRLADQ
jgi:hypothetical protein